MANERWTAAQLPDLSGQTVVVTGASSGIGAVTAGELSRAGAKVVLGVRDVAKGEAAAARMAGETDVRRLDLTDLASVREFAGGWAGHLDILINNAGIMMVPAGRTADGFELQIGTNHLGHFALTNLLLPQITGRIVTVTSDLHKIGKIKVDDLNWENRTYKPLGAYCQSKLANVLFTLELQRRLTSSGSAVRAVAAHPGVAETNLISHVGGFQGAVSKLFLGPITQDGEHGALPTLYAATRDIPGGSYVGPDGLIHTKGYPEISKPSKLSRNADLARRLWDASASLTHTDFAVPSTV
jgi:NAD(P)-dependent dehydrogenase (short-subunit alcohol dehydrogenase family)